MAERKYQVTVTTGKAKGAGTNATVQIKLIDKNQKIVTKTLDKFLHDDFVYGTTDTYTVPVPADFGELQSIILYKDTLCLDDWWFVEHVKVHHEKNEFHFPLSRWIPEEIPMKFNPNDSCLPQVVEREDIELFDQRQKELVRKRDDFKYQSSDPTKDYMPRTVIPPVPREEVFSIKYDLDVKFTGGTGLVVDELKKWRYSDEFSSFNDMYKVYSGPLDVFPIPEGHQGWRTDEKFAQLRLTGPNCTVIQGCLKHGGLPKKLILSSKEKGDLEKYFLEGKSLDTALKEDRLFFVDYEDLDGYIANQPNQMMVSPIALFYSRMDGTLIPLAIQLFQNSSKTNPNPVFFPTPIDEERVWLLAKFWFNVADSNYHEPITHLLNTHLVAGDFVTCFHHHISPSHPIYKLMLPHFIYLLNINTEGMPILLDENAGAFENILTLGVANCMKLINQKYHDFKLQDKWFDTDLENRGVKNLANYHYKEDGKLMFDAIHKYIRDCVEAIYDGSDKNVYEDFELQDFRRLLCEKKVGMQGVWGSADPAHPDELVFNTMEEVSKTLTTMVFILTNVHAAANFNQYDEYAYPPNYPFRLQGAPPKDKSPVSEEYLVKLFDVNITLDTMNLGRTLSLRGTNTIGNYEVTYEYKPQIHEIYKRFVEDLKEVQHKNDIANAKRKTPYIWLSPKYVPNSISI